MRLNIYPRGVIVNLFIRYFVMRVTLSAFLCIQPRWLDSPPCGIASAHAAPLATRHELDQSLLSVLVGRLLGFQIGASCMGRIGGGNYQAQIAVLDYYQPGDSVLHGIGLDDAFRSLYTAVRRHAHAPRN